MSIWILQESWTIIKVWRSAPSTTQVQAALALYHEKPAEDFEREAEALIENSAEAQHQLQEHPIDDGVN